MTRDPEAVYSVFSACSGLSGAEREAELARRCAGDRELESRVRRLLATEERDAPDVFDESRLGLLKGRLAEITQEVAERRARVPLPRRIGPYVRGPLLGEGGMGRVYAAVQARPRRMVALKILRPDRLGPRALQRFEREVEILARLEHPGIVTIFDAGFFTLAGMGVPYLAMELIRGADLGEWASSPERSPHDRLHVLIELGRIVAAAHRAGVLHRDLKPENVIVDDEGRPHVLDFGIARMVSTESDATLSGEIIGTLESMSPEQLSGAVAEVDERTDLFALAVMAHRVCLGAPPHDLEGLSPGQALRRWRTRSPALTGPRAMEGMRQFRKVLRRGLAFDRACRPASVAEFVADLERISAGAAVRPRWRTDARGALERAWRPGGILAGALMTLLAFMAAWSEWGSRATRPGDETRSAADWNRYLYSLSRAAATFESEPALAHEALLEAREAWPEPGWEWRHLHRKVSTGSRLVQLPAPPKGPFLRTARSGVVMLELERRKRVLFDAAGGTLASVVARPRSTRVSTPDLLVDHALELREANAIYRVRLRTGELVGRTGIDRVERIRSLRVDHDAGRIVVDGRAESGERVLLLLDSDLCPVFETQGIGSISDLASSQSRRWLGVAGTEGWLVIDLERSVVAARSRLRGWSVAPAPGKPDSLRVATDNEGVVALDGGRRTPVPRRTQASVTSVRDAGNGDLLTVSERGLLSLLRARPRAGRGADPLSLDAEWPSAGFAIGDVLALRNPQRVIATVPGRAFLWCWETERDPGGRIMGFPSFAYSISYAPESDRLAGVDFEGRVVIFDGESKKPILTQVLGGVRYAVFSPSGSHLVVWSHRGVAATREGRGPDLRVVSIALEDGSLRDARLSVDGWQGLMAVARELPGGEVAWPPSVHRVGRTSVVAMPLWGAIAFFDEGDLLESRPLGPNAIHSLRLQGGRVVSLARSSDGLTLAAVMTDGRVHLVDGVGRKLLRTLPSSGSRNRAPQSPAVLHDAAFLTGGRLMTAGHDGRLTIWDWQRGQRLISHRAHEQYVHDLEPDLAGARVFSCGGDGLVRVW